VRVIKEVLQPFGEPPLAGGAPGESSFDDFLNPLQKRLDGAGVLGQASDRVFDGHLADTVEMERLLADLLEEGVDAAILQRLVEKALRRRRRSSKTELGTWMSWRFPLWTIFRRSCRNAISLRQGANRSQAAV
jgi:hypothetical protein